MTLEYANLKPWICREHFAPSQIPIIMKWTHSIFQEDNVVTEWGAIEQARALALDIGVYNGVSISEQSCSSEISRPSIEFSAVKKHVGFSSLAEIFIGMDEQFLMHRTQVPEICLGNGHMPWASGLCRGGDFLTFEERLLAQPSTSLDLGLFPVRLGKVEVSSPARAIFEAKPNREEEPQLLDPSDSSDGDQRDRHHRDPRRPPLRSMPAWIQQLWNLLQEEGAVEMEEEGPVLYFQSFFVSHRDHPHQSISRPVRIDRDFVNWEADFRFVWEDFEDAHAPLDVFLVQPELPLPVTRGVAGTLLLTQHPMPRKVACVTVAMYDELPAPRRVESAHSFDFRTRADTLLHFAGAYEACEEVRRSGFGRCTIRAGRLEFDQYRAFRLADGFGIVIHIPLRVTADEWERLVLETFQRHAAPPIQFPDDDEGLNLMARSAAGRTHHSETSSSTDQSMSSTSSHRSASSATLPQAQDGEEWCLATIYTLEGDAAQQDLPWTDEQMTHEKVALAFSLPTDAIFRVYHVAATPEDLVPDGFECMLLQRTTDQPSSDLLRLTLVDIEYRPDHQGSAMRLIRRGFWLPQRSNVISVIRLLGYDGHCNPQYERCALWHNHVRIDIIANEILQLEHGDYFKFHLPWSPDEDWAYLFGPECLSDPIEETDSESLLQRLPEPAHAVRVADGSWHQQSSRRDRCRFTRRTPGPQELVDLLPRGLRQQLEALWNRPHLRQRFPGSQEAMLFDTWFVSWPTFPQCRAPRLAALNADVSTWLRDLRRVWRDHADAQHPISIHLVRPEPTGHSHGGHLVVTQHVPEYLCGTLCSFFQDINDARPQIRFATLLPQRALIADLLEQVHIAPICRQHHLTCRILDGHEPQHQNQLIDLHSGLHIRIAMQPTLDDALSLMQQDRNPAHHHPGPADEGGHPPDQNAFQLQANAPPFQPGGPCIHAASDFVNDLFGIWRHQAFAWEQETPSALIETWFVDHRWNEPHCRESRVTRLFDNFWEWEIELRRTWQDLIDTTAAIEFHLVDPQPPMWNNAISAHVVIVQSPHDDWVTSLATIFGHTGAADVAYRIAITTNERVLLDNLIIVAGLAIQCLATPPALRCEAWFQDQPLRRGIPMLLRSGASIRIRTRPMPAPAQAAHAPQLIQHQVHRQKICLEELLPETQTHDPADLLPELQTSPTVAVRLRAGSSDLRLPDFIEIHSDHEEAVQQELLTWGHDCIAFQFGGHQEFLCLPKGWKSDPAVQHYMYCTREGTDSTAAFLHTHNGQGLTDHEHMRLLHQAGFLKTAVIAKEELIPHWTRVIFVHHSPTLAVSAKKERKPTPWPTPLSTSKGQYKRPFCPDSYRHHCGDCRLGLGIEFDELAALFDPTAFPLCTTFEGLELPESTRNVCHFHCADTRDLKDFDRLVIFTDGSSLSGLRHQPPALTDLQGLPDTWAFIVLGEIYGQEQSELYLVGWQAQPVHYDVDSKYHIGTDRVGSDAAEKEALFWAALWRLTINLDIPTVFCSDSLTTGGQAQGALNTQDYALPFIFLRSAFQALEAFLPGEDLQMRHVQGHSQDPWNDFVDEMARKERDKSFYLPRPTKFDANRWKSVLPALWMIFHEGAGLPAFTRQGFDAYAPQLPDPREAETAPLPSTRQPVQIQLDVSLGTVNVLSLSAGPHGHSGRVDYLRQQFRGLCLNILGLQETRSPQGVSQAGGVLRLASGALRGHHGTEIWVNLQQPYGAVGGKPLKFHRRHFVVRHADPRLMIVQLDAPHLSAILVVAHAPQSGQKLADREQWWRSFSQHCEEMRISSEQPLFLMIDANAAAGPQDSNIVGPRDDAASVNTSFFKAFLEEQTLCLPATFSVHTGITETWTSPSGDVQCRIDHVAIPQGLRDSCTFSTVVESFDTGHAHPDHALVGLQLQWSQVQPPDPVLVDTRPRFEREDIGQSSLAPVIDQHVVPAWDTDIDTHVTFFTTMVQQALVRTHPGRTQGPKKPYVDAETWTLRLVKLKQRRQVGELHRRARCESLFRAWRAWATPSAVTANAEANEAYRITLDCARVKLQAAAFATAQRLRKRLMQAKQLMLQQKLEDLPPGASASTILRAIQCLQGPTNPKKVKRRPFPQLRNKDGQICASGRELQERWSEFFSNMEGGQRLTNAAYRQIWLTNLQKFCAHEFDLTVESIPSLCDLERAYSQVTTGKAMGLDSIPPEACRKNVKSMARATYSQLLKLVLHGQEAMQHKGGRLTAAYKGKGLSTECSSYRSLLVSSQIGKCLHKTIRSKQSDLYESFLQTQQLGGRKGIPVQLGMHQLRSFLRFHQNQGDSCCILFLDLREAFYRVLRPLAVDAVWTDGEIAGAAQRLGLPDDIVHDLHTHLREPSALAQAQLPAYLRNCLTAIHTDTWFVVDGQTSDLCRTTAGSRPGDCFADTIFGYLWARVLKEIEAQCVALDLLDGFPHLDLPNLFSRDSGDGHAAEHENQPFLGPCWMDDLAIPLAGKSATAVVQKAGVLAGLLLDRCISYAMSPNLAAGKTELLLALRGTGSRPLRQQFLGAHGNRLFPVLGEHGPFQIRVVTRYKHLGGIIHHGGDQRQEARQRLAVAHQTFTQQKRLLYGNSALSLSSRQQLFDTVIGSALTYGAESWVLKTNRDKQFVHASIMRLYRRLLKCRPTQPLSDEDVLCQLAAPSPTEVLRRARLRYLATLVRCGRTACWGLLAQDKAWLDLICDDLRWMWTQLHTASSLGDPQDHFAHWIYIISHHGNYWKRLVNRATLHAIKQRCNRTQTAHLHKRIFHILEKTGTLACAEPIHSRTQSDRGHFGCMLCGLRCRSKGGEGAHIFRKHGQVNPIRRLFGDTWCPCCRKEFHTATKMQLHLRNVARCRRDLWARGHFFPVGHGIGSSQAQERTQEHDGALPPQVTQGPALQPVLPRELPAEVQDLIIAFVDAILDRSPGDDLEQILRQRIRNFPISWTQCAATLEVFLQHLDQEAADTFDLELPELQQTVEKIRDPESWAFLKEELEISNGPEDLLQHYEEWCANLLASTQPWRPATTVPAPVGRDRIILHAFSGRRRVGDYQWYLDQLFSAAEGVLLHVVSLDLVIDSKYGNLGDPQTQAFWLHGIQEGWVHGFLGGPPCATWSRARAVSLGDAECGHRRRPRPVRSESELWGLAALTIRELAQTMDGNNLLGFCLEALAGLAALMRTGILEHPAEPEGAEFPSIWKLPILQLVLSLPGACRVRFAQGLLGADSAKPTEMLTINLPSLPKEIVRWRIVPDLPRHTNIGLGKDGEFLTAQLKEYPPALCAALAACTATAIHDMHATPGVFVEEQFLERCRGMVSHDFGSFFGPDHVV